MSKLAITLLAAPLALAGVAAPAFAEDDVRSVVVRYDDLNLTSASGRDRLIQRVKNAVEIVCDSRPHYRPTLAERARAAKCEAITMRDADVQLAAVFDGSGAQYADKGGMTVSAR
jgi:UrcA family protein